MPAMVALPAKPSPMAAPMAPPPRASPPPMKAPAELIAMSCVEAAAGILGFFLLVGRDCARCGPWASGRRPSVTSGDSRVEIEQGEQGEDERLDRADEQAVEQLPDDVHHWDRQDELRREVGDQDEHDASGEDVAEEPEGERQRLGDLLHH